VTAMITRSMAVMRGIEFQIMILPLAHAGLHRPGWLAAGYRCPRQW
jgi:hypothetical protein